MSVELRRLQVLRDEVRDLLIQFFEYEAALARPEKNADLRRNLKNNFADLRRSMVEFWKDKGRFCPFLPGLAGIPGIVDPDPRCRQEALAFLLPLLPESSPNED